MTQKKDHSLRNFLIKEVLSILIAVSLGTVTGLLVVWVLQLFGVI